MARRRRPGSGLGQGLLVLGVMWWSWVGYAWLTSVVDPEEGAVRFAMFAAMAALLVVALCVPEAFGDSRVLFACAYAVVRFGADRAVRAGRAATTRRCGTRCWGLAVSTAIGVGAADRRRAVRRRHGPGAPSGRSRSLLDMVEPYLFGSEGWQLAPEPLRRAPRADHHHRAGRVDRGDRRRRAGHVDAGVVAAAVLGIAVAAALWWLYFDIVALVAERRLSQAKVGREQNEIARDSFSYLHFPMVAGIVLLALGTEEDAAHVDDQLSRAGGRACSAAPRSTCSRTSPSAGATCTASAASGSRCAVLLVALIPVATEIDALVDARAAGGAARGATRLRDAPLRRPARAHAPPARGRSGLERVGEVGQPLVAVLGDEHEILHAHAAVAVR